MSKNIWNDPLLLATLKKKTPGGTVSGDIVSFNAPKAAPLKSLRVGIEPVQDLHGYDNPWPAGGGKNKWHLYANGYYNNNGGFSPSSSNGCSDKIPVTAGATYVFGGVKATTETLVLRGYFFDQNDSITGSQIVGTVGQKYVSFTVPVDAVSVALWFSESGWTDTMTQAECDRLGMQMEAGSSLTSYSPYSNLCPISGWDAVNLWRTGKNLFDMSFLEFNDSTYTHSFYPNSSQDAVKFAKFLNTIRGSTVVISAKRTGMASGVPIGQIRLYNLHGLLQTFTCDVPVAVDNVDFTTFTMLIIYGSGTGASASDIQIELGSTESTYAPYSGTVYPITIPVLGKNLLAPAFSAGTTKTVKDVNYLFNSDGTVSVSGTCNGANAWQDVASYFSLPAGTYTLSGGAANGIYLSLRDNSNTALATSRPEPETFTISEAKTVRVRACVLANTVVPSNTVLHPMLELGSTATSYEPYTNTVYDGYIQVGADGSAELVVDRAYAILNDPDQWTESSGTQDFAYQVTFNDRKIFSTSFEGLLCSSFLANNSKPVYIRWTGASSYKIGIKNNTTSYTLSDIQQMAENGEIAILYELATPLHYPLSSISISTLKGENVVWADSGDIENLEYAGKTVINPTALAMALATRR